MRIDLSLLLRDVGASSVSPNLDLSILEADKNIPFLASCQLKGDFLS